MTGLIMIGYQGIGKSACGGKENCIDLESGNFFILDKREDNWYIPYCKIAISLAEQGYTVFVSSHKEVRDYLSRYRYSGDVTNKVPIFVFCPRISMKEEWINRLKERYNRTKLSKDYRALMNAKDRYEENILELFALLFPVVQPEVIDYDLMDYVRRIKSWIIKKENGHEEKGPKRD